MIHTSVLELLKEISNIVEHHESTGLTNEQAKAKVALYYLRKKIVYQKHLANDAHKSREQSLENEVKFGLFKTISDMLGSYLSREVKDALDLLEISRY